MSRIFTFVIEKCKISLARLHVQAIANFVKGPQSQAVKKKLIGHLCCVNCALLRASNQHTGAILQIQEIAINSTKFWSSFQEIYF